MSNTRDQNPRENAVLRGLRGPASRATLAARFQALCDQLRRESATPALFQTPSRETIEKQIYRLETGKTEYPQELYKQLYCTCFSISAHDLFGDLNPTLETSNNATFLIQNHKLIPMYIGADAAAQAVDNLCMSTAEDQLTDCHFVAVDHPRGLSSTLWVWRFGVALFHVTEQVEFETLADLAIWHRRVYDEQMSWANERAVTLLGAPNSRAQYAMPVNWLVRSIWEDSPAATALRILTMPRILLKRQAGKDQDDRSHAHMIERSLMRDGFDSAQVADFGVRGISLGVASWAGVAYYPTAPTRALSEAEVISYELTLQALWSYCDWIRSEVEMGRDP